MGVPPEGFHASRPATLRPQEVLRRAGAAHTQHEPDLLILDSLRSLAPGLEENDSAEMEADITPIRRLAQSLGISVPLVHHSKKGGTTYRGSSAIPAAIDASFHLARADGDEDLQRAISPAPRCGSQRSLNDTGCGSARGRSGVRFGHRGHRARHQVAKAPVRQARGRSRGAPRPAHHGRPAREWEGSPRDQTSALPR